jgi:hypothetical protein
MPVIANDGTLVRGSIDITLNSVIYTLLNFKRGAKARSIMDYSAAGKPAAASHAEDFEHINGTIRQRSDKAAPPKFVVFSYDSKNWYIVDSEDGGSTEGLREYTVDIIECINAAVVIS